MLRDLNLRLFLALMLVGFSLAAAATDSALAANEAMLQKLDSVIANNRDLVEKKELRIDGLRHALSILKSDSEKLGVMSQLYDEYLVYDSDSALNYATECARLASIVAPADIEMQTEWKLNKAFIYIVQGLYDRAMPLLESINSSSLSPDMKAEYYNVMEYAYSMRSIYLESNEQMRREDVTKAYQYLDSIRMLDLPQRDKWLWVPITRNIFSDDYKPDAASVERLRQSVDKGFAPSRDNAINAYWLARYYDNAGNEELKTRYLAIAAIYDATIINREIAALQELASSLFVNGQLTRAYNYLLYSVQQANTYHNRYRMVSLSDVLPAVRDAYRTEIEKRDSRLSAMVLVLAALSLVLVCSIVFIVWEYRKLKRTRNTLSLINDKLNSTIADRDKAIEDLELANNRLTEANQQKLGLLAYAFKLTSMYINALEEYRKKLLKKYKVRHIDDLGTLINDPELVYELYQGFYEGFDKTVLSIFPDFIEEYNQTVGEANRVAPESVAKSKTLNTKLRIYALRRLGINKSSEIAEMLNVSIRTVYNNRPKSASDD